VYAAVGDVVAELEVTVEAERILVDELEGMIDDDVVTELE